MYGAWALGGDLLIVKGAFELRVVQVRIEAVLSEQLVVVARLDDRAVVHDQDEVGVADR